MVITASSYTFGILETSAWWSLARQSIAPRCTQAAIAAVPAQNLQGIACIAHNSVKYLFAGKSAALAESANLPFRGDHAVCNAKF